MNNLSDELQMGKAGEHLVCFDLILQGYNAFLSDQGLPYDVVLDHGNKLWTIQVRTTSALSNVYGNCRYRFQNRMGRAGKSRQSVDAIADFYAFVALDIKTIAYIYSKDILGKDGCMLQTIDFKSKAAEYQYAPRKTDGYIPKCRGKFLQDYVIFPSK